MREIWEKLEPRARMGLLAGALAIITVMAAIAWLLRADYQVLFADLNPQDAGAMVAELEKMKIPYRLADDGASILVEKGMVHQVRLKLMSRELPLQGTLGLELFNNSDFGMTEFAQKVNYQRALQGEITRTILSLSEIRSARVHLALPEEGLFKRASGAPKASVTLALKQGQVLRAEQVSGIQRLVAAAVPGGAMSDVTVIDEHGVALTRQPGEMAESSGSLELKKETERYLTRKVAEVLEKTFGPGQAIASVDVSLDMDQIRRTVEDVLAPPAQEGTLPTGTVVRERETLKEGSAPLDAKAGAAGGSSQREVDYSVGRKIENVVRNPGSIRRIAVVAVVKKTLDNTQLEQLKTLVAASVGASFERGDAVVVQMLGALAATESPAAALPEAMRSGDSPAHGTSAGKTAPAADAGDIAGRRMIYALSALLAVIVILFVGWRHMRTKRTASGLSAEKHAMLAEQLRTWLDEGEPIAKAEGGAA